MAECFTERNGATLRKRGYRTGKLARQALHSTAKKHGWDPSQFSVYKCRHCKQHHFGRDDENYEPPQKADVRFPGVVKWFRRDLGYGFIIPDDAGPEVFVHRKDIKDRPYPDRGDRVTYAVIATRKGVQARQVRLVKGGSNGHA